VLGVTEVWFWEDGTLRLYHLHHDKYDLIQRSELSGLEDLDIELLKRCVLIAETDSSLAMRTFAQALGSL
jgi:hypothetical protein